MRWPLHFQILAAMVGGAVLAMGLTAIGIGITDQVLMSAGMCLISCWLARRLVRAERAAELPA